MVNYEFPSDSAREADAFVGFDQRQRQIDAGGDPRRGLDPPVGHEDAVRLDHDGRKAPLQVPRTGPVRRSAAPVEQPRFRE